MKITRDNRAQLGSQISFPPKYLWLKRDGAVLPDGLEQQVVSSYEPGRREGLMDPFAVEARASNGEPMAGVRIVVQIANSSQGAAVVIGGENVTDSDGVAQFNILKLRLPPGNYRMELHAADFFDETPAKWLNITVRKCARGEVAPPDAPDTCKLW